MMRLAALILLLWTAVAAHAAVQAVIDTDEGGATPVAHRYIHGVIPDDAKFQLVLPVKWNGKVVVYSRGFSGTEFSTGAFMPAALNKGYAFAASDEGWNRSRSGTSRKTPTTSRASAWRAHALHEPVVKAHYGRAPSRTLIMGGSNGGHHTKWMLEDYPNLYDGGIAGYGFNSQVSQWGSIATVIRNYDVIAPRIDDIIAKRAADPTGIRSAAALAAAHPGAAQGAAATSTTSRRGCRTSTSSSTSAAGPGRRRPGSSSTRPGRLPARLDAALRPDLQPNGGALLDSELGLWEPEKSPGWVQRELRKLDLSGDLQRPVIIMHGTYDTTVSPGETAGYKALVEKTSAARARRSSSRCTTFPGMGHGGTEYNELVDEQIDALEAWIDWLQSDGRAGAPAPATIGIYPRETSRGHGHGGHHDDDDDDDCIRAQPAAGAPGRDDPALPHQGAQAA